MDFRIGAPSTQPLQKTRPLAAPPRTTTPLPEQAGPARQARRDTDLLGLEANPDFQSLQTRGKLTPEVMAQLRTLSTQPLADGIDRRALIATALRELANPERISQGNRETCAAAVVQAKLAEDDPAEYLRLLSGLASPAGAVTLANGETLERDANWQVGAGRSLTGNLMQPAFMQFATGSYDNRTDSRAVDGGRGKGLYAQEQARLMTAVSGAANTSVFGNGPEVLKAIQSALARGQSVPVVLTGAQAGTGKLQAHSVLVERIQGGQVTFLDPSGKRRTVSLEAFTARLESANLPKALVPASLLAASEGKKGVLAGMPDFWGAITGGVKAVAEGFKENVAKPVVQAVQSGVGAVQSGLQAGAQAINDHVIQPVANAIGQVGGALNEHVLQPIAQAAKPFVENVLLPIYNYVLKPIYDVVLLPIYEYVLKPIYESLLKPLVVDWIPSLFKKAIELSGWLEANNGANKAIFLNIAAIACIVTPGLNALALVISIGTAIDAGKKFVAGLQHGDWKEALGGAAELMTAVATAVGGPLLSQAIGKGAIALARLATGVGKLASAGVAFAEMCDAKAGVGERFSKVLSIVALVIGGGSSVLGEQAEAAAAGFTSIASKANSYYDRSLGAYRALLKGESNWKEILKDGLLLTADLQQDVRNDAEGGRLNHQIKSGISYAEQGTPLWETMTKGKRDLDTETFTKFYNLAAEVNRDVQNDWKPDVAPGAERGKAESDRYTYLAKLWQQTKGLSQEAPFDQMVGKVWEYCKQMGASKGDEQFTLWLRGWTSDLDRWGAEHGQEAQAWAQEQIDKAWKWWGEQHPVASS